MFGLFKKTPPTTNPVASKPDLRNLVSLVEDIVRNSSSPLSWHDIFGNFKESEIRGSHSQMNLSAIFCAINMYIGTITALPRYTQRLSAETGLPSRYVKTTEHPSARIWCHYANDELSSDDMLKYMIFDLMYADGNFYALPEYDQQGRINRLHYIHPSRIPRGNIRRATGKEKILRGNRLVNAKKGELIYTILTGNSYSDSHVEGITVSYQDIFHMKGTIPDSEYHRSMGVMENNARSSSLYEAAEKMGEQFYKKGSRTQTFLATEARLDAKYQKELEEIFNGTYADGISLEELFSTRVLQQGLKPVNIGLTPDVMKFVETRAFSVEDVGRWFQIPTELLHSRMGSGGCEDLDKSMVLWIQTGLGNQLSNIEKQFRNAILPRSSQTTFGFFFYRLHLYKTVINEFSQAIRNLFEIGVLDRLAISDLIGVHIDPKDPYATQRYVPANIISTDHSQKLADKAAKAIDVMNLQIEKLGFENEHSEERFEMEKEAAKKQQSEQPSGTESDVPNPAESKPPSEDNSDKKTRPTVPRLDNVTRMALYNVLSGLKEFHLRVLNQKKETRGDDLTKAMDEWYPKLKNTMRNALGPWEPVLDILRDELFLREDSIVEDLIDNWISLTRDCINEESLTSEFEAAYNFLKETEDE